MSDHYSDDFFVGRGIKPEVARERGYVPWIAGADSAEVIAREFPGGERSEGGLHDGGIRFLQKCASQVNGFVIRRYVPQGIAVPPILAQIRPNSAVKTGNGARHYHGDPAELLKQIPWPVVEAYCTPMMSRTKIRFVHNHADLLAGGRLASHMEDFHQGRTEQEALELGEHSHSFFWFSVEDMTGKAGRPGHIDSPKTEKERHNAHLGVNTDRIHVHVPKAKYIMPPTATEAVVWDVTHDHVEAEMEKRVLQRHLVRYHQGEDVEGSHHHPHTHEHYGQGALKDHVRIHHGGNVDEYEPWEEHDVHESARKMWNAGHAKRIDVHPSEEAERRLREHDVIFFGIEGTPKSDAMLSVGAAVFSVLAVGMTECDELPAFCREYLQGKTVVVVPDGDWAMKGEVENLARLAQGRLLQLGAGKVHIAAPPTDLLTGEPTYCHGCGVAGCSPEHPQDRKGVDDYLGHGGTLAELISIDREPPDRRDVEAFIRQHAPRQALRPGQSVGQAPRIDGIRRSADVIIKMACLADSDGVLSVSLNAISKLLGCNSQRVDERVKALVVAKALTIQGSLATRKNLFGQNEWVKKPTITLNPYLCGTEHPPTPLGKVVGSGLGE